MCFFSLKSKQSKCLASHQVVLVVCAIAILYGSNLTKVKLQELKSGGAETVKGGPFWRSRDTISGALVVQAPQPSVAQTKQTLVTSVQSNGIISQERQEFGQQFLQPDTKFEAQHQQQQQQQQQENEVHQEEHTFGSVKGTPGVDFPAYTSVPNSKFSCLNVPYEPGMYADESTGCQAYHLCYQGRRESFLCGTGTLFNQAIMGCDFWHSVECQKSSQYYQLNAEFGKSSAEPSFGQQQVVSVKQQSSALFAPLVATKTVQTSSFSNEHSGLHGAKKLSLKPSSSSSFVESSSFTSSDTGGKASARKEQFRLQLANGLVSPGQRVRLQQQHQHQQATTTLQSASESSMQIKLAKMHSQFEPMVSLDSDNSIDERGSIKVRPANSNDDDNQAWRPYFKSKASKAVSAHSSRTTGTNTTTQVASVSSSTTTSAPKAVDQEPTFSADRKPTSGGNSHNEPAAQVPKGSPPPQPSSVSSELEPDVGATLTSTTPAPVEPTVRLTSAPTSPPPPPSSVGDEADAETTPRSETSGSLETDTTNAPSTTTTVSSGDDQEVTTTTGAEEPKKRRQTEALGQRRANSSLVEYASELGERPKSQKLSNRKKKNKKP